MSRASQRREPNQALDASLREAVSDVDTSDVAKMKRLVAASTHWFGPY